MDASIAVIGDGVAALIALGVLKQAGVDLDTVAIYGDSPHPLAYLRRYAQAIGQQHMRSESSGHLAPYDFPGLAWDDTKRHPRPWPLLASLLDRYNPPLSLVLEQADRLIERLNFFERKVTMHVSKLLPNEAPVPGFELYDAQDTKIGYARHIVLALGHAGLAWPEILKPLLPHPAIRHAYEGPIFQANQRIAILGSGMAAAHLWCLALEQGAQVFALHRRPLRRQRLNAPRTMFSAAGIDGYQRLPSAERLALLQELSHGTFPWRPSWQRQWRSAQHAGQLSIIQADLNTVEIKDQNGASLRLGLNTDETLEVDQLVCSTGFVTSAPSYPLVANLVDSYHLPLVDQFIQVSDSFTLMPFSQPGNVFGVIGALARWALPVADTFAGIKYATRRLTPHLMA